MDKRNLQRMCQIIAAALLVLTACSCGGTQGYRRSEVKAFQDMTINERDSARANAVSYLAKECTLRIRQTRKLDAETRAFVGYLAVIEDYSQRVMLTSLMESVAKNVPASTDWARTVIRTQLETAPKEAKQLWEDALKRLGTGRTDGPK
ncbi:MAG: hypothetical protein U0R49_05105 [Fimbriimonadales bacterium]